MNPIEALKLYVICAVSKIYETGSRLFQRLCLCHGIRLGWFKLTAAFLLSLIFYLSPQQLPVIVLKLAEVTLGGILGYWLDRNLYPNFCLHQITEEGLLRSMFIRRALIVSACVIGTAIAL